MVDSPLINAAALRTALAGQNPPSVLDVRWALLGPPGRQEYAAGHIPAATFVDLETELAAPPGKGGRHPLPYPATFVSAMQRAGVNNNQCVVLYDQDNATAAARAWWLLRYYGHPSVKVLDGGWVAWTANGGEISTEKTSPALGNFAGSPGAMPVVDATGAAEFAARGVLLDARAAERYSGEVEPVDQVAGHIPGAVSMPTSGNVGQDGRFLSAGELRERFASAGIRDDVEVAAYCGSGVTACQEVLALNVAGFGAALYPESWSGWITDPSRPVALGVE
jgi:thiosulfate/3-mercaptopyruvate sulfurtransferase